MLTTKPGTTSYNFVGSSRVNDGEDFISVKMTEVKVQQSYQELNSLYLKGYLSVPFCPVFALCGLPYKST